MNDSDSENESIPLVRYPRLYGTRTFFQLAVGPRHCAQVVVHLRVVDLSWWNHELTTHHTQLLQILKQQILPQHFMPEIMTHASHRSRPKESSNISENNLVTTGTDKRNQNKKRTRPQLKATTNNTKKSHDIEQDIHNQTNMNMIESRKYHWDFKIIYGSTIQITYKLQPIQDMNQTCTLVYKSSSHEQDDKVDSTDNPENSQGQHCIKMHMHSLVTLSQRIVMWCFPFDSARPTQPIPFEDGGFHRQDMIPMASLFKSYEQK